MLKNGQATLKIMRRENQKKTNIMHERVNLWNVNNRVAEQINCLVSTLQIAFHGVSSLYPISA